MKFSDPLLKAWQKTLARKRDMPAIFATSGEVIRTFLGIEEHALAVEANMPPSQPFNVHPVQIGNHADWPSLFLACLRTQRVVLPLDESISKQQTEAAFSIAAKSGITDWGEKPPTLFKLTSGTTAVPRLVRSHLDEETGRRPREELRLELVLDAVGENGAHAPAYSPAGSFTGCARFTIAVVL